MSGSKVFIDTNIFLRAIVRDDLIQGAACEKFLRGMADQKKDFFTSSLVLAEIAWTLFRVYHYQKDDAAEILSSVASLSSLKFSDKYSPVTAIGLYKKYNVKFADCLIASHPAIASGRMPIVSYDRDFDRLGIKRFEPPQFL